MAVCRRCPAPWQAVPCRYAARSYMRWRLVPGQRYRQRFGQRRRDGRQGYSVAGLSILLIQIGDQGDHGNVTERTQLDIEAFRRDGWNHLDDWVDIGATAFKTNVYFGSMYCLSYSSCSFVSLLIIFFSFNLLLLLNLIIS